MRRTPDCSRSKEPRDGHPWASWGCALLVALALINSARADDSAIEFFEREVRPVFVEKCHKCHGAEKQSSALRLDSREAIDRGGEGGAVIIPGDVGKSRLIAAIRHEGDYQMPPKEKLTDRQIAAITKWVEVGAPWPKSNPAAVRPSAANHWAFQPVRRPRVPSLAEEPSRVGPVRSDTPRLFTPVDAFILARLEQAGLKPSPPADRRTLIRRATVDITGLPPTPEDVEAFVADPDPLAYEKLIDRLLASPHQGEQWARHWLDVARYADTKGYVYAREERFWVHAWAYRDWIVQSLNEDLPYDRFLLLQIAADQAAPNDASAQAAMGFLTLGRRFLGVKHDIIDDRIDVVTRGTMGLTVGCARCHDHKYDPIPTRDYYSLYGVFQNCTERMSPVGSWDSTPDAARDEFRKRQYKLREGMERRRTETSSRVRARIADYLLAQFELHKYPEEGFDQVFEPNDVLPAFVRRWRDYLARGDKANEPIFAAWRAFAAIPAEEFSARVVDVCRTMSTEGVPARVKAAFAPPPETLADVAGRYGQLFKAVDQEWQAALEHARVNDLPTPTALDDPESERLRQVLYGPDAPCEPPQEPIVAIEGFFTTGVLDELWKLQGDIDRWLIQSAQTPGHALTLVDRPDPIDARVLRRGNPAQLGDEVPRQFLQVLSGPDRQPFESGSGRYELAQAIVSPQNPLTARVIVNRVWLHHFGAGLVRTPSDFGLRAETPSHPELLDWLTSRFIEEGWSLKWLHRQMLLSATYQQSSRASSSEAHGLHPVGFAEHASQLDPSNRLLWRMNPRRLAWEELRDALLSASGELQDQLGGRPFDLFTKSSPPRRTLYGLVDRQFLPSTLRVFDFANPDLHIPVRSETSVPQQALFLLNHPLVIDRAEALADEVSRSLPSDRDTGVDHLFQRVFQRTPNSHERAAALSLLKRADLDAQSQPPPVTAWKYGYGVYNEETKRVDGFTALPYFTGKAWQGGANWPDGKLGWVQLTATGGHAGNDVNHAAIRRWVAPHAARVQVRSTLIHDKEPGDGIRGYLVSSRHGLLHLATLHNSRAEFNQDEINVEAGDTLDFVVDIHGNLNNDDFTWEAAIGELASASKTRRSDAAPLAGKAWNSRSDFGGTPTRQLSPWAQLAQVLFLANEFFYVD